MKARLTYVPLEVAEQFEGFIVSRNEEIADVVKAKTKDFRTLTMLKLIYQLRTHPMTFTELFEKSQIRMKRSFLNYLDLCLEYNFVRKEVMGQYANYFITEKGRLMLELFTTKDTKVCTDDY